MSTTVVITNPLKDNKSLKRPVAREFGDVTILNSTKRNFLERQCAAERLLARGFGMGFVFLLRVQGLAKAGDADPFATAAFPNVLTSTVICPNMPSSPLPLHVTKSLCNLFQRDVLRRRRHGRLCDVHDANAVLVLQRSNMCILRSNY